MKLAIYCRISRIKDGNDLSISDQTQKGISKAKELGLQYELYVDEGISGTSDSISDRPEFERLLGDITAGYITHVFTYDQSRLERNPQMRFVITDLFKKKNIIYITQMGGVEDLNDPQQAFFGDLLSVINKFHVTSTKIKVKSALRVRVKEGKTRGIMPYGYTKDANDVMMINDDEAVIVKRIYALSLAGIGCPTIANTFNVEGIQTRYNKIGQGTLSTKNKYTGVITTQDKANIKWVANTVRTILINTIYKGDRLYSGIITKVPAIFDGEYWDRVQNNLSTNSNNRGKKVEYRYLLKGLLRCGICGRNMYGKKRINNHDNHYMCSSKRIKGENCGNRSINIDKIEFMIWQNLFYDHGLQDKINKEFNYDADEIQRIKDNITRLEKINEALLSDRKRAIDLVIKGIISDADIASNLVDIDSKIKENDIILSENKTKQFALENSNKIMDKYENDFDTFNSVTTFEQKKKIVNDFINNIVISYDNEYRIDIEFKIDIPTSTLIAPLTQTDNSYFTMEQDTSGIYNQGKVDYIPKEFSNELYSDGNTTKKKKEVFTNNKEIYVENGVTKLKKIISDLSGDDDDDKPVAGGGAAGSADITPSTSKRSKRNLKNIILPLLSPVLLT